MPDSSDSPTGPGAEHARTIGQIIGGNIRATREMRGLSQAELGRRMGKLLGKQFPRQVVTLMERGDRAFAATEVVAVAYELGTSVASLYREPAGTTAIVVSDELTIPLHQWKVQPDGWQPPLDYATVIMEAIQVLRSNAYYRQATADTDDEATNTIDKALTGLVDMVVSQPGRGGE